MSTLDECAQIGTQQLSKQGNYLVHGTDKTSTITINNADSVASVFATSSEGSGLQAELPPEHTIYSIKLGRNPTGTIECQKPAGYPTSCVSYCPSGTKCNAPALQVTYTPNDPNYNPNTVNFPPEDYLNEQGSLDPSTYTYIFLDTLINNTNTIYEMAITTAPLYQLDVSSSTGGSVPGTLAHALDNGTITFRKDIYPLMTATNPTLKIGSQSYPITFLASGDNALVDGPVNPDGRFTLYGKNDHNPRANRLSTKRHMALYPQSTSLYPSLALGPAANSSTYQTIILYPRNVDYSCQPVIYIGRDTLTNAFYALTYLLSAQATFNGIQCCVQSQAGTPCTHDTLYCPASQQGVSGCNLVSANEDGQIQQNNSGRLKVVIDPMPDAPQYGWASSIESMPGLYWPGQPDFGTTSSAPQGMAPREPSPFGGPQKASVALNKTTSRPPTKVKKG